MKTEPAVCPLCKGTGKANEGLKDRVGPGRPCRACSGKGIVWPVEIKPQPFVETVRKNGDALLRRIR